MLQKFKAFLKDEEGATAVEYALMVAAIAAVIVFTVFTLGGTVDTTLADVDTAINNGGAAAP